MIEQEFDKDEEKMTKLFNTLLNVICKELEQEEETLKSRIAIGSVTGLHAYMIGRSLIKCDNAKSEIKKVYSFMEDKAFKIYTEENK